MHELLKVVFSAQRKELSLVVRSEHRAGLELLDPDLFSNLLALAEKSGHHREVHEGITVVDLAVANILKVYVSVHEAKAVDDFKLVYDLDCKLCDVFAWRQLEVGGVVKTLLYFEFFVDINSHVRHDHFSHGLRRSRGNNLGKATALFAEL